MDEAIHPLGAGQRHVNSKHVDTLFLSRQLTILNLGSKPRVQVGPNTLRQIDAHKRGLRAPPKTRMPINSPRQPYPYAKTKSITPLQMNQDNQPPYIEQDSPLPVQKLRQ